MLMVSTFKRHQNIFYAIHIQVHIKYTSILPDYTNWITEQLIIALLYGMLNIWSKLYFSGENLILYHQFIHIIDCFPKSNSIPTEGMHIQLPA